MSTINNTDLFLVSRAGVNYKVTGATIAAFVGGVLTFSAGTTGLTPSAPQAGAVVLSGTLNVASGGTGATTAAGALTNLLPSQSGNPGKVLTTNGSVTSWVTPSTGTVTNVTATAPIVVATGTSTPALSFNSGLGTAVNGGFLKASTPIQNGPPTPGTAQLQAIDGSVYWDNNTGLMFVRYNDGSSVQWVQVIPSPPSTTGFTGTFQSLSSQTVTVANGIITSVV